MYLLILWCSLIEILKIINLHPTMYLLIHNRIHFCHSVSLHLHPTMYLLIPPELFIKIAGASNLHPTMYLLILRGIPFSTESPSIFTSHYVSINSSNALVNPASATQFTSHYVSINSALLSFSRIHLLYLHPTMYLLIQIQSSAVSSRFDIYIPLCIY